jgi:N-glycosidase YbiA
MSDDHPPIPPDNRILFFRRDRELFPFFSNFYPAPFTIDGELWATAEHYYQSHISLDPDYRAAIRAATHPGQAKRLSLDPRKARKTRRQSWFFGRRDKIRPDWDAVKLGIMRTALAAKFGQNPELAARLVATGDAELIEDSASDAFWGLGRDGTGENRLGRELMELRAVLRNAGR